MLNTQAFTGRERRVVEGAIQTTRLSIRSHMLNTASEVKENCI